MHRDNLVHGTRQAGAVEQAGIRTVQWSGSRRN